MIGLIVVATGSVALMIWLSNRPRWKAYNQALAKCPACGNKMTKYAWSRSWIVVDMVLWICLLATVGLLYIAMTPLNFVVIMTIGFFWNQGKTRLYHAYWMWRHPLRCEKGGHAAPVPDVL